MGWFLLAGIARILLCSGAERWTSAALVTGTPTRSCSEWENSTAPDLLLSKPTNSGVLATHTEHSIPTTIMAETAGLQTRELLFGRFTSSICATRCEI